VIYDGDCAQSLIGDSDGTLVDVLHHRAEEHPNRHAFSFMAAPGKGLRNITYFELDRQARRVAGRLMMCSEPGDRVLLMTPQGLEFVIALFGSMYAGRIAVPAFPPHGSRGLTRLQRIADDSGATVIAADRNGPQAGRHSVAALWPSLHFLSLDNLDIEDSEPAYELIPSLPSLTDIGFLQYTSGSTGDPKGVIVSHANILHNVSAIAEEFGQTSESRLVCWLPLFHDMGLVGNVLLNVFAGSHCILIPPGRVLQRPIEWLKTISDTGATTSGGPNFIYDLCVRKIRDEDLKGLDLSRWRVAYNGAEVVRPETLERFAARFGSCGFSAEAFRPCYGLAESTLLVSVANAAEDRPAWVTEAGRVSCGRLVTETHVVIVDPETSRMLGEGETGEIWISSPSVAAGYWNRPDSRNIFRARIVDDPDRTYLLTGDLGFIRRGELFVVDRLKDLIIVRGRNLYAHDVETTVSRACGVLSTGSAGYGAAIAVEVNGEERLAVVQECDRAGAGEIEGAIASIRAAVVQEHETAPVAVVLVRNGLLPRTTSGKVIRRQCARLLEPGHPGVLAAWLEQDETIAAADATEQNAEGVLLDWISRRFLLAPDNIPFDEPLIRLGLDSLGAMQLAHHLERVCRVETDVSAIIAGASVNDLATAFRRRTPRQASDKSPTVTVSPLSYGQESLYYLQALEPDSSAYHIAIGLSVRGPLKPEALRSALDALTAKRDVLRTTFHEEGGRRYQRVHSRMAFDLLWEDGGDWQEQVLNQYLRSASRAPFSLDACPLWRVRIVRRTDDEHVLLWVIHHLIADLWSLSLLLSDLIERYQAVISGEPVVESMQGPSFIEHVVEEREFVASPDGERQLTYWMSVLAESTERLKLPPWRDATAPRTSEGESVRFRLDRSLSERLRGLTATLGSTLSVGLLAAFQLLLWRYSRQDSFRISLVYAGRGNARFAGTAGYFANLLVINAGLRADLSFAQMIGAVQQSVTNAIRNGDYPYGLLVQEHQRGRAEREDIFDAIFVMQSSPHELPAVKFALAAGTPLITGNLELSPLPVETGVAQFDLALAAAEIDGEIAIDLRYKTSLISRAFAECMLTGLSGLVEQMVSKPGAPVGTAALFTGKTEVARASNFEPTAEFDSGETLVSLFERQAHARPGAVAISYGQTEITYADLNNHSNALACRLMEEGVGQESLVVLNLGRHPDLIVAILGVLKAGGAYVPIDENWPPERAAWVFAHAKPSAIVTRGEWMPPEGDPPVRVVRMESVEKVGETSIDCRILPDQLAYVIYTSGSTGVPKGCLMTHRNVVRLFGSSQDLFRFSATDSWSMFHSPAFDFSVWEIWGALLYGGRVVIVPYEVTRSPEEFYQLLLAEQVTMLSQTPTAFRQLAMIAARSGIRADRLRYVVFGGERLEPRTLEPWVAIYGFDQPKLVNMYGITETTVHVTHRVLSEQDMARGSRSPIGVPLSDLGIRLLDPDMHLQPDGAVGAIYVSGPGVGRGYMRRPDLTAERFVPDPYAVRPGSRLYASGDLAVVSDEAGLEYLSRADQQVKIRGHRIEPGEVQAVIARHAAVGDCIVQPYAGSGQDQQLVAYFVAKPGCEMSTRELRAFAASRLPDYMVPSVFVALESWPLTANGKLNRNALPDPASQGFTRDSYVAPKTQLEFELVRIFEEVLGVHPVGIEDSYFELGGDSIRSISVRARARERGIDFSLQDLLISPTIAVLAERARRAEANAPGFEDQPESADQNDVGLYTGPLPEGVDDAYPLTQGLVGLLFHSQHGEDYESYVTSLHLRSPFEEFLLRQSIESAVKRHAILRTTFDTDRFSEPMQLVWREGSVSLDLFDVRNIGNEQQEHEIAAFLQRLRAARPTWDRLPLVRWAVHLRANDSFQLTLSEPFLDGWSVGLLLTEVLASYRGKLNGESILDRPPLGAAFRESVLLEREALASGKTRQFWDEQIRELPIIRLPEEPLNSEQHTSLPISRVDLKVEAPMLDALRALAARLGLPVKSLLLAAHMKALSVITGSAEAVTGLMVNTRPEKTDGERVVGLFMNPVLLCVRLPIGKTWTSLIREVYQAEAEILPHRRFPYAEMRRRSEGRDLFEAVFNFTHFHLYREIEEGSGIEIIGAYASEQTYFDLTAQFHIDNSQTSLVIALDYRVSRFERGVVRHMLEIYRLALQAMISQPDTAHDRHCCVPEEDLQFLAAVNRTARTWEFHTNLCELIERQVHLTPGAPAVRFMGRSLTYAELNARANQMARLLRREGLSKEDVAGVMLERSPDLVVLLLAILKTGAAYLPLDPEHPIDRIGRICEDSGARLIVTKPRSRRALPLRTLSIDSLVLDMGAELSSDLDTSIEPDALAYIIYTSGSTGAPKGAMNTHRGICNRLLWMQQQYGLGPEDRVLQKTPYTFDVSVWEFFWPLIAGACLVVASPGGHLDPEYLAETIRRESITTIHFVPTMLRNFLAETQGQMLSLKNVICSGEALDRDLIQAWYRRHDAALHNLYGPAEAAIDVTAYACDPAASGLVPIGRPISNIRIYILDDSLQPAPVGAPGEIFIAGIGVGRGYIGDAGLTGARFLPDLFADEPGAGMYRTGDRGRYMRDGNIEFLGRLDGQVKIHGQRIELGEIESALRDIGEVRDAVVLATADATGSVRLVAWVVQNPRAELQTSDLRRLLGERLPRHMIPSQFRFTSALPLNRNGKIDRRLLEQERMQEDNRIEDVLARIEMLDDRTVRELLAGESA
jgi:amino acid adenylation domain-containing protein